MFKNIGKKFMTLAKVMFWIMFTGAMIGGIIMIIRGISFLDSSYMDELAGMYIGIGFGIMGGGTLIAWLSNWVIYSWGNLVDNVQAIRDNNGVAPQKAVAQAPVANTSIPATPVASTVSAPATAPVAPVVEEPKPVDPRVKKLDMLLANGLITEEEYKKAVANL